MWNSPENVHRQIGLLLPQLGLLFDSRRGQKLPNGYRDSGFNCHAKAFVATYLARLRGLAVDTCHGEAVIVEKWPGRYYTYRVNPHAWAGSPLVKVIDLSIRDFEHRKVLPVINTTAYDWNPWRVAVTASAAEYQRFGTNCPRISDGAHLLYWIQEIRAFKFEELNLGGMAVYSDPTRAIAARYPGNNVIAKAILHLHRVADGERLPLIAETQKPAWDELARWQIDAMSELKRLLTEAGTLHASAGWEQDRSLVPIPQPEVAVEAPAPPCVIAA